MTLIDRMKFVDICCGGGGASLGAAAAGFEVALGVDVDVAALKVFKANFPLAKTSNLQLPCDKNTHIPNVLPRGTMCGCVT